MKHREAERALKKLVKQTPMASRDRERIASAIELALNEAKGNAYKEGKLDTMEALDRVANRKADERA
jgi:hypothetical protein